MRGWCAKKYSNYSAKWKVNMPQGSKYHAKWQVLLPNHCKYNAIGTRKEIKKTYQNKPKTILHCFHPFSNESCFTIESTCLNGARPKLWSHECHPPESFIYIATTQQPHYDLLWPTISIHTSIHTSNHISIPWISYQGKLTVPSEHFPICRRFSWGFQPWLFHICLYVYLRINHSCPIAMCSMRISGYFRTLKWKHCTM